MAESLDDEPQTPAADPARPTLDKGDLISISVAGLSLLVALASLLFSIKTHYEAKAEHLSIEFSPHQALDEARLVPFASGERPGIIQEPWGCLLSNNGDRTISLVELNVWVATDRGRVFYTHIHGGLLDLQGERVQLPITLDPGQSRLLYLVVGLRINEPASTLLAEEFGDTREVSRRRVEMFLADHGVDVYGNEREVTRLEGGGVSIEGPGPDRADPLFVVNFRTSRGQRFSAAASLYADLFR